MEWLRLYHEVCTDPKWPAIARNAQTNQGTVLSVWIALLTYASQQSPRGSIKGFYAEDYDVQFGYEDGTCQRVLDAMEKRGVISNGRLAAWEKRQPKREREDVDYDAEQPRSSRGKKKKPDDVVDSAEPITANESQEEPTRANKNHQEPITANESQEEPPDKERDKEREGEGEKERETEGEDFKGVTSANPVPTLPPDGGDAPSERFDLSAETVPRPPRDDCPHQKIIELYHEILPELPHVHSWGDKNRANLRARWRGSRERQNLDWWRDFFQYVGQSDFLMGRTTGRDGKPFFANLGWLVISQNFDKVLNGNYNHGALDVFQQAAVSGYRGTRQNGGAPPDWGALRDEADFIDVEAQESEV